MRWATPEEQEAFIAALVRLVRAAALLSAVAAALLATTALLWCIGWVASR